MKIKRKFMWGLIIGLSLFMGGCTSGKVAAQQPSVADTAVVDFGEAEVYEYQIEAVYTSDAREYDGEAALIVGTWTEFGYRIWDGPHCNIEIRPGTWFDEDYNHAIIEAGDGLLRYAEIVSIIVRVWDTPWGPIKQYNILLNLYPGIWLAGSDGFVYGKRFW